MSSVFLKKLNFKKVCLQHQFKMQPVCMLSIKIKQSIKYVDNCRKQQYKSVDNRTIKRLTSIFTRMISYFVNFLNLAEIFFRILLNH